MHGHWRNLVVMATGTGRTVVAGLDYRRLSDAGLVDSVLFVAHREEILSQSQAIFRHIMRSGSFGERFVAGERPQEWRHVFASVQSLARLDLEKDLAADRFEMVIVDEFHHASEEWWGHTLQPSANQQLRRSRWLTPFAVGGGITGQRLAAGRSMNS